MEFKAYLVKLNSSFGLNIGLIGLILFLLSIFLWGFHVPDSISLTCSIVAIIMVVSGAIMSKGGLYKIDSGTLTIRMDGIEISSVVYSFKDISKLKFYFHSFYSQSSYGFFTEDSGYIENGMSNYVAFIYNNVEIEEKFYIENMIHAELFFQIVNELKKNGISYDMSFRNYRV